MEVDFMMKKKQETVSEFQMAALFLAFLTGSAIVNIPAPLTGAAKNNAWLSLWLANGLGMIVLYCVLYLHQKHPEMTFIQYCQKLIGKVAAYVIAIPLFIMFFIMLSLIVGDIGEFFKSTMMRETPEYIFTSLTLLLAALTVRAGIEVMARMFTLLIYIMFFFSVAVMLLTLPSYHPEFLLPLLSDGFKPVLHGAYIAWGFPYSEIVAFSFLLQFVRKEQAALGKFMYAALIINGIALSAVIVCTVMALGSISADVKFSLFVLARMVDVREIIERIESVIGIALIVGSYMKTAIVLYVINLGLSQLFQLKDDKILIFPIALVVILLSLTNYKNELEFAEFVGMEWPIIITFGGIVPLVVLTLVSAFRQQKKPAK